VPSISVTDNEHAGNIKALSVALRELDVAESLTVAAQICLDITQSELYRVESFVSRHGSAPRYGAAYDSRLREATTSDKSADLQFADANSKLAIARANVASVHKSVLQTYNRIRKAFPAIFKHCCLFVEPCNDLPNHRCCSCADGKLAAQNPTATSGQFNAKSIHRHPVNG